MTPLTPLEFRLLQVFMRAPGRILTREQLITEPGGPTRSSPIASSTTTSAACARSSSPTRPNHATCGTSVVWAIRFDGVKSDVKLTLLLPFFRRVGPVVFRVEERHHEQIC